MIEAPPRTILARLLEAAGVGTGAEAELVPLAGGANNRVYRVRCGSECAVLKAYFQDGRRRLEAEVSFLEYARACGTDAVPAPLARDDHAGVALYELVAGSRMSAVDVDARAIEQAASLVALLNEHRARAEQADLLDAAEACFSISEHLERVASRVAGLSALEPEDELDEEAAALVVEQLRPAWEAVRDSVLGSVSTAELHRPLDSGQRCVSPSDFGFHNALIDDAARIRFIDFEYAGWDDPAKLVCDFFCQLEVPAPIEHQAYFEQLALAPFDGGEQLPERILLLTPVYRVKWACIVLNDFLPRGRARRAYALGGAGGSERRLEQIRKTRELLGRLG
jgi:hypothetical protein